MAYSFNSKIQEAKAGSVSLQPNLYSELQVVLELGLELG